VHCFNDVRTLLCLNICLGIEEGRIVLHYEFFSFYDLITIVVRSFSPALFEKHLHVNILLPTNEQINHVQQIETSSIQLFESVETLVHHTIETQHEIAIPIYTIQTAATQTEQKINNQLTLPIAMSSHRLKQAELTVPAELTVLGDRFRVRQCIANYLSNAIKFAPNESTITISLSIEPMNINEQREAALNFIAADDENTPPHIRRLLNEFSPFCLFRICVRDCGRGLSADEQSQLFETFHQVGQVQHDQQRYSSSGLGLNIVKSLVQLQGGQCGVDSEPDKGADFWFTIPLQIGIFNDAKTNELQAINGNNITKYMFMNE
jgi:signal transduction histidine kinase